MKLFKNKKGFAIALLWGIAVVIGAVTAFIATSKPAAPQTPAWVYIAILFGVLMLFKMMSR